MESLSLYFGDRRVGVLSTDPDLCEGIGEVIRERGLEIPDQGLHIGGGDERLLAFAKKEFSGDYFHAELIANA